MIEFIRSWGYKWLHYSYGSELEAAHIGSPLFQSLRRVNIFDPIRGKLPPRLGNPIDETKSSIMARRAMQSPMTIDLDSIYTFTFDNCYFDPLMWEVKNIPLIKEFDVSKLTKSIRLMFYEAKEDNGKPVDEGSLIVEGPHTKRNVFMQIQLENKIYRVATKWQL